MRYSKGRIRYLAENVIKKIKTSGAADFLAEENLIRNNISNTIEKYFSIEDDVYESVVKNLDSRKKKLIPGSIEWDTTFNKLYEEEMSKRFLK